MIRTMPFMREKSNTDELMLYGKIVSWWEHERTGNTAEAEQTQVHTMLQTLATFLKERSESQLEELFHAKSSNFRSKGNFASNSSSSNSSTRGPSLSARNNPGRRQKFTPKFAPPNFSEVNDGHV